MIKQHFQNELVKCGYPDDLTIEYSLGYCQGDGVAFYGDLSVDDVKALMNRLFSTEPGQVDAVSRVKNLMAQKDIENMLSVLREYGSCDLSITRNSHGHHYSHWNCMNIDDNVDFTGIFP
ncbi:NgrC, partial [Vibrio parahaemolyticus]|nr:NgrC [Vibrio parahaemolyticus]